MLLFVTLCIFAHAANETNAESQGDDALLRYLELIREFVRNNLSQYEIAILKSKYVTRVGKYHRKLIG